MLKFDSFLAPRARRVPAVPVDLFDRLWQINHGPAVRDGHAAVVSPCGDWRAANHDRPIVSALHGWLALVHRQPLQEGMEAAFVKRYLATSVLIAQAAESDVLGDGALRAGDTQPGRLLAVHRDVLRFAADAELQQGPGGRLSFADLGALRLRLATCCGPGSVLMPAAGSQAQEGAAAP